MKSLKLLVLLLALTSCGQVSSSSNEDLKISVISPDGTPTLALANFHQENKDLYNKFDVVAGSDPLVAAFTNKSYDVIVAPTNLGAKLYKNIESYQLFETIVWGNLYLASKTKIDSLSDLKGEEVTMFGGNNATPYIVLQSLITMNSVEDVTFKNVDDVASANAMLKTNKAKYIVTAEPSISKLQSMSQEKIYTFDLQNEWKEKTELASYPQASIFIKKSLKGKIDKQLEALIKSVNKSNSDKEVTATNALQTSKSFEAIGKDSLIHSIPNCHFGIEKDQKTAIENYFNQMKKLNLAGAFGGTLPSEDFYYHQ